MARVPDDATAYPNRQSPFVTNLAAAWMDPAEDAHHTAWAREGYRALAGHLSGGYVNFMNPGEADRTREAYVLVRDSG
ncbi:hypothetical protein [Streptomyces albidoflavus]|uniref:hypothetical protein n=1 Tax=Streptomyces albidoflavus TaxID=1886 RepID=UPI001A92DE25|nr:hypothetical protein [Streptomyces albidoflavus]